MIGEPQIGQFGLGEQQLDQIMQDAQGIDQLQVAEGEQEAAQNDQNIQIENHQISISNQNESSVFSSSEVSEPSLPDLNLAPPADFDDF